MLCLQSEFCINSSQFSLSFLLSFPPQHASSTNAHRDWVFASHITPAHLSRHSNIRHIVSTIFSGVAFRKLFARCPSFSRAGRCRCFASFILFYCSRRSPASHGLRPASAFCDLSSYFPVSAGLTSRLRHNVTCAWRGSDWLAFAGAYACVLASTVA